LDNIVLAIVVSTFNVLRLIVVNSLDVVADGAYHSHELRSELLVDDESLLVVRNSEFLLLVHGVRVKKTCTSEAG